jgi:hypothetical protein
MHILAAIIVIATHESVAVGYLRALTFDGTGITLFGAVGMPTPAF